MSNGQVIGFCIFLGCFAGFLIGFVEYYLCKKPGDQRKYKPKATVAVYDENNQIRFLVDRNNQLVIQADDIDGEARICAETTEELAVLLLPVARRVLKENGGAECN